MANGTTRGGQAILIPRGAESFTAFNGVTWRESFQEIAEFLTGEQADVADDRLLAAVLHRHRGLDAPRRRHG